jgi:hypothetical protein
MPSPCPILWWNDTVLARVSGQNVATTLPSDSNDVAAICSFIRGLSTVPKAVKIFYHSPAIEHFVTPCPKGSRRTIQRALCHRTPALDDLATTWAAHPVRAGASGTTTLLYIESQSRLPRLRAALAERGIILEGVFPVLGLVEEMALSEEREKPRLVLLISDDAAAVYWITPVGDRHAAFFDGISARERIIRELIEGFSIFKASPVFTVINVGTKPFDLTQISHEDFVPKPSRILSAAELLDGAGTLGTRETYNFLPPGSPVNFDHLCYLTAIVFLFAGSLLASAYLSAIRSSKANLSAQQAEERALEDNIERLRANQTRVKSAQEILAEAKVALPVKLRLLEALNHARSAQISIQTANLGESTWTVTGRVQEGPTPERGPLQAFIAALQKGDGWTVGADRTTPIGADSDFTLSGTIP